MALIRGTTCDFPCPKCLVPKLETHQGRVYAARTTQSMKNIYEDAYNMRTATEGDRLLQSYGLRDIPVSVALT